VREGYSFSESAKRKGGLIKEKGEEFALFERRKHLGNEAVWMAFLLFRKEAAVAVAVHEGKYGRNTVPLQTTSSARDGDLHC
jgi:hypothetical protein